MPGYVMHLAEGELILDILKDKERLTDAWEQCFLTGLLLPDTRLKEGKKYSHFWDPNHLGLLAQGPDIPRFLVKYQQHLTEPVMLGYLAHLHLDAGYLEKYWPTVIAFCGAEGEPEVERDKITDVKLQHLHKKVPVNRFFSPDYYYGEYLKLNGYFIDKYHLRVPRWEYVRDFAMEEVRLENIKGVCGELERLLSDYHVGDEDSIQIFDLEKLEAFIGRMAREFIRQYRCYIKG